MKISEVNVCPMCQKTIVGDLLTVKLNDKTVVYHGCLPCWDTKVIGNDPVRRALWNFAAKHMKRQQPARPSIDELLKKSDGKVDASVALRIVEFAQSTKNPNVKLSDVVAAERRAKMKADVIVGGASGEEENEENCPETLPEDVDPV